MNLSRIALIVVVAAAALVPMGAGAEPQSLILSNQSEDLECKSLSSRIVSDGVSTHVDSRLVNTLLAETQPQQWVNWLEQQGYAGMPAQTTATTVVCNQEAVDVYLVPFVLKQDQYAHLLLYKGSWQGKSVEGAAMLRDNRLFIQQNGALREVTSSDFERLGIYMMLNAVSGPVPFGKEESSVVSSDELAHKAEPKSLSAPCKSATETVTGYTPLGFVAFRYHVTKSWCFNGAVVTNPNAFSWVSDVAPFFFSRGDQTVSDYYQDNNYTHVSVRQGAIENCPFDLGCISAVYPRIEFWARANGQYITFKP